jgi:hypothetical protein
MVDSDKFGHSHKSARLLGKATFGYQFGDLLDYRLGGIRKSQTKRRNPHLCIFTVIGE